MRRLEANRYPGLSRVLAVAKLTIHSAFKFRLVTIILPLLAGILVALPYLIKHNGTAEMLTQVVLSYSLSLIVFLLGLVTVWLACGSLAKEIQECQMQMIAVKPISRWQIWLGKWLGISALNAGLLLICGAIVLGILYSESKNLSEEQQALLNQKILVARGGLMESPPDLSADIERILNERVNRDGVANIDREYVREKVEEEVWAMNQIVKPNHLRRWEIDFGWRHRLVEDKPLHIRVKFYAAQIADSGHYPTLWIVGNPETGMFWRQELDLSPTAFHEIAVPAGLISADGILHIECRNYTQASLIFPIEEDLEVLFPEGTFFLNFIRSLSVILLWLALLTALGLSAASVLSFPVASFFVFALLTMVFSSNLFSTIVEEGTVSAVDEDSGKANWTQLDWILVPIFGTALDMVNTIQTISPIESLASGRSIPIDELAKFFFKLVVLMGIPISGFGMFLLHRNELAGSGNKG